MVITGSKNRSCGFGETQQAMGAYFAIQTINFFFGIYKNWSAGPCSPADTHANEFYEAYLTGTPYIIIIIWEKQELSI